MRQLICCCFCIFYFTSVFSQAEKALLVCGDSKVLLVDYEKSVGGNPEIIWTWDSRTAPDIPEQYRTKFATMDDCKSADKGRKIIVSASSGAVAILNSEDRSVLFYAMVPNAHSVALLPNNRLAAAASTNEAGNRIMLFDTNQPNKLLYQDSLYSAHGVVWDHNRKSLFALGYQELREYKMATSDSLVLVRWWEIPGESGHDLQPALDENNLLITEHTGAWSFNIKREEFQKISGFPDDQNIKSLSQHPSGQYLYTVPEESWWTYHVSFFQPDNKLAFPHLKVYKARWYK
ncbi:MAG: hypothetical protein DHS20C17_04740 [Cyclobacteriaceae bacterium]|nr:MAG: hypothetical protein DHS20C17_04740 [Cyclobacteriaceae bacterium]